MKQQMINWGSSLAPFGSELLWTALPSMLLYGMLGFVLALGICYQLARKCLLVRRPRAWHVAAKLSYVLILLALPLLGGGFGAVHSAHRMVNQALERDLQPVVEAQMPALRVYLEQQVKLIAPGQPISVRSLLEPYVQGMYYQPTSSSYWERSKAHWINEFILRRGSVLLTQVLQEQLIARVGLLGEALKGANFRGQATGELAALGTDLAVRLTTDVARQADFSKLDKSVPMIFVDAIKRQAGAYFNSLKITLALFALVALLLVWGEIMLYRHYYLRRHPAATALPVPPT
ncbi:hypothetical protein JAB5_22210 [Janthinobacterium sp. HH103]|uniref:hypothetical protein n=1 Tax=unclassified Janthinobacterium TaxID=2610881 RepID=UPI000874DC5D|nr:MULTISPECIES: hypothetical protein [unclassified Janthinobacterium]OEZ57902.1 hypothetical protein JAB2_49750 [Janthinobacterium sp. HH100]OEZ78576.1 hypothetical protein JAB5_22210 [Janthinobacterium sp. HH103]QOU75869.1 hypothetical protein JAB4_053580 [Janthinobacterium sp. HH102]